jgi:23S rRNA (guanosine2251-2'-O)-methyltransferase
MLDSEAYRQKKSFFNKVLTVYGRKAVLEVLQDSALTCHAVHLAETNIYKGIIADIQILAQSRDIPLTFHSRLELSRISKNGKQDQGVAADIICPSFDTLESFLQSPAAPTSARLLALDGISNPQNLGMIIRSAAAGNIDGIIWSSRGNAALGPLVIKASAGTLYRAPILTCEGLPAALKTCRAHKMTVCTLEASAPSSLFQYASKGSTVFVLGNETEGVSRAAREQADTALSIPMRNGVESLNVAVTASLIAFSDALALR